MKYLIFVGSDKVTSNVDDTAAYVIKVVCCYIMSQFTCCVLNSQYCMQKSPCFSFSSLSETDNYFILKLNDIDIRSCIQFFKLCFSLLFVWLAFFKFMCLVLLAYVLLAGTSFKWTIVCGISFLPKSCNRGKKYYLLIY